VVNTAVKSIPTTKSPVVTGTNIPVPVKNSLNPVNTGNSSKMDSILLVFRKNLSIVKNQQQYKTHYDLHRQDLLLNVNDLVLVKTRNIRNKFDLRYEGPFRIIKQLGRKTFIVQHVEKVTLTRQVTTDIIIPLVERWDLSK
jgi:hypothetical protein